MNKHLINIVTLFAIFGITAGTQRGVAGTLVSAGFYNSAYSGTYGGVEPLAQTANPTAFGNASYWDQLPLGHLSPETSPSFSNLADNNGNPTSVGLQFTGSVDSYNNSPPNEHGIFGEFIYLNSGSLDWVITGLVPGSLADLYFYGYGSSNNSQSYRTFNMALDTTGNGTLNGNYTVDYFDGGYAANITVSPTGSIKGQMQYGLGGGQSSWTGLQVFDVPEPSTLALSGVAFGALLWRQARRKSC